MEFSDKTYTSVGETDTVSQFNKYFKGRGEELPTDNAVLQSLFARSGVHRDAADTYLKGAAQCLTTKSFESTETYMLYFFIESLIYKNDITRVVLLKSGFRFSHAFTVGKKTALNIEEFSSEIESAAEKYGAERAMVFRKIGDGDFKSEFTRANSLFSSLKSVKLYDYVLKTNDSFRSLMAAFRKF